MPSDTKMSRFILLDPSLVDTAGHHYDFARNVLDAADGLGRSPVLAGHRRCLPSACGRWPIRRTFRDGLWTHQAGDTGLRLAGYLASACRRMPGFAARAVSRAQEWRDGWRARRLAVDIGHVMDELGPLPGDLVFIPNATLSEVLALTKLLAENRAARLASWHLEFRYNLFERGELHRATRWHAARRLQRALRSLRRGRGGERVCCYADTEELTDQYEALRAGPFVTLPIPVDPAFRPGGRDVLPLDEKGVEETVTEHSAARPLRVAYVGDARIEKGYARLPELIGQVWRDLVLPGRVQFIIQSNCSRAPSERGARRAAGELRSMQSPAVQIVSRPLESTDYRELVLAADLLLLPYCPLAYETRSSGIMAEALAAGIPAIVPSGTWLAGQLRDQILAHRGELKSLGVWPAPAGAWDEIETTGTPSSLPTGRTGVVCAEGPDGLARALLEAEAHYEHYRQTARAFSERWRQRHGSRRLVETLTQLATAACVRRDKSACAS